MDDEERAEFKAMRAREAEMEAHFMEAEQRVEQSQSELREQQVATARMQAEWEAMRAEVRRPSSRSASIECTSLHETAFFSWISALCHCSSCGGLALFQAEIAGPMRRTTLLRLA